MKPEEMDKAMQDQKKATQDQIDRIVETVAKRIAPLRTSILVVGEKRTTCLVLSTLETAQFDLPPSILATAISQVQKMKLGQLASVSAFYEHASLVVFQQGKLCVAFVTDHEPYVGAMLAITGELEGPQ
ncbi:hypothetical protein M885DRAFT_505320 [Pelagophyceae sp. CCMP2097]|nr:hypothetical protein M885DRAFT_505320 [Pelagophyceae sp. CCMP2097]|mmetsp:Transcript_27833/g.93604  ORF Transcript_27833/g.93604 Transcript_27833/m.93604 type:complete len:129 (-) Transcript_27833:164-550(-)